VEYFIEIYLNFNITNNIKIINIDINN